MDFGIISFDFGGDEFTMVSCFSTEVAATRLISLFIGGDATATLKRNGFTFFAL